MGVILFIGEALRLPQGLTQCHGGGHRHIDRAQTGLHRDFEPGVGRAVLPPMPIPAYRHFTDADLAAIFAYLQSIPPVRNRVPQPLPPVDASAGAAASKK